MTIPFQGHPAVVLGGWLGCQPKSLRRYEELYQKLGFKTVLSRIASPIMVVKAATTKVATSCTRKDHHPRTAIPQHPPETIQELGWDVLEQLHKSQCSHVLFHGFSNGGCFLWEQVTTILNSDHGDMDDRLMIDSLRSKLVGVVFDSSPAYFLPGDLDTLNAALQYCTWRERLKVKLYHWTHPVDPHEAKVRGTTFWQSIRNDPWDVRQLYLYSHDDHLTPYQPLEDLIHHRRGLFGAHRVFSKSWPSSPHCMHLRTHKEDYQEALESFINKCLPKTPLSKL